MGQMDLQETLKRKAVANSRQWRAIYKGDTSEHPSRLYQYERGRWNIEYENKYPDIDRDNLLFFDIIDHTKSFIVRVHFDDARKRLIYRRRTQQTGNNPEDKNVILLAGWQMNVGSENVQVINYITEDNKVFMSSGWTEPFGPPKLFRKGDMKSHPEFEE